jgi:hypothetical protein
MVSSSFDELRTSGNERCALPFRNNTARPELVTGVCLAVDGGRSIS